MEQPMLRVRHTQLGVVDTLGPGTRSVVWVQGCTLHCPGCIVPEMWGEVGGELMDPVRLAHDLLGADPEVQLTVSGGEPTEQPEALALLLATAHQLGRSTWVYTGRTLEELLEDPSPAMLDMLAQIDVLVDGRYEYEDAKALPYRGSTNQRIIRLTDAIPRKDAEGGQPGKVAITIDALGELLVIGVPPPGFLTKLRAGLQARGVTVVPSQPWR